MRSYADRLFKFRIYSSLLALKAGRADPLTRNSFQIFKTASIQEPFSLAQSVSQHYIPMGDKTKIFFEHIHKLFNCLEKVRVEAFADFFLRLFGIYGYALNLVQAANGSLPIRQAGANERISENQH
jgi:hypothetical protein